MTTENVPPLRVREQDGSPNAIPVYEIIVSNGTLTNLGAGRIALATGAGGSTGGTTTPGGNNGEFQFNSGNLFGGATGFTYSSSSPNVTIIAQNSSFVPLVIEGAPSQASNLLNLLDSGTNLLTYFTKDGNLFFNVNGTQSISNFTGTSLSFTNAAKIILSAANAAIEVAGSQTSGSDPNQVSLLLDPTISNSAVGGTTILYVNPTISAFGTGSNYLINLANGGSRKFSVNYNGLTEILNSANIVSTLILGTQATSGGHAVRADRLINTGAGLIGQSNLSTDVTLGINTTGSAEGKMLITSGGTPLGGVAWVTTGGGVASSVVYAATGNQYVTLAAAADLTAERVLGTSTGITLTDQGANGNVYLTVNTNIRDKIFTFYAPGVITTAMLATQARIRIPFNMDAQRVDLAVAASSLVFGITADLLQYSDPSTSAGISLFTTSANKPQLGVNATTGNTTTFDNAVLYAGSYLGFKILQIGTATGPGSSLTMTIIARAS